MKKVQFTSTTLVIFAFFTSLILLFTGCTSENVHYSEPFLLSDDGGWCWFQDPRIVTHGDHIVVASVANGRVDSTRAGDVDAIVYNINTEQSEVVTLHDQLQANDHATPSFLVRPDSRWLALYTRHHSDSTLYYRISEPGDPTRWQEARTYIPSDETVITYSNPFLLENENNRIYNFFRGLDDSFKPSYVWSDDQGSHWQTGHVFIDVPAEVRHRPYVKYRGDGQDTIHMIYTEGHPRDYDNSVYHIFYRDGSLYQSDGTRITSLSEGLEQPRDGTRLFQGDANHVAWTTDIVLDSIQNPMIVFSVKNGSANASPEENGQDQRYYYGQWDGNRWIVNEMAFAGSRLYAGEDEYTGLAAIDPQNPDIVYISADVNPSTGVPLISSTDNRRHYELFRGETDNGGENWTWTAITTNSDADNLRPMIADGLTGRTFLVWLKGEYRSYTDYSQEVFGMWIDG